MLLISCVKKHKYDNTQKHLTDKKMSAVLTDIFLMETYINDKNPRLGADSLTQIKKLFYPAILKHHHLDSTIFYSTLSYYQAHPAQYLTVLSLVDSNLLKIKPLDTTSVAPSTIQPPKDVEKLLNFRGRTEELKKIYKNDSDVLKQIKKESSLKNK